MTREEILKMAREAGLYDGREEMWWAGTDTLERFAALVAAAEREACAKVCEDWRAALDSRTEQAEGFAAAECAAAIRARDEK